MLRLPINLLVTADTGLAAYEKRVLDPNADPFDMRQIAWLGRTSRPSTAVSRSDALMSDFQSCAPPCSTSIA